MGIMTYLRSFKERRFWKRVAHHAPSFPQAKKDLLLTLLSDKKFPLFLEFLELTISEKLVTFSSIDLLDESRRPDAIRLQQQMRGVYLVIDLVEDLINRSKDIGTSTEEDEKEN